MPKILEFFQNIYSLELFEPHSEHFIPGHEGLMWFIILSNALIVLAYILIPSVSVYLVRRRKDLVYNWVFLLVGLFISLCGVTHFMHIIVFFYPLYYIQAIVEWLTVLASAVTFFVLLKVVPEIVKLTVPGQLEEVRKWLSAEVEVNRKYEEELFQKNQAIEKSNQEIASKNEEMVRLNNFMHGRELKVQELEKHLAGLKQKHGN